MMSNCQDIQSNLLELIEQMGSRALPSEVTKHLQSCSACADLVKSYASLARQMNLPEQPVPDTLWRSVQAQVNARSEIKERGLLRTVFSGNSWALSLKSGLLVVAAVIGIYLGSGFYGGQTSYAETIADDYASLLVDYPVSSLADSYLELDLNGDEEAGQ